MAGRRSFLCSVSTATQTEVEDVGQMKRFLLKVIPVGAVFLVAAGASSAATVRGIAPFVVSGNIGCSQVRGIGTTTSATFSPPANGASSGGITLLVDSSTRFGWYVDPGVRKVDVRAIIVKGGPNSNVYIYPGGDYSDGPITAPTNPKNGKPYDVGAATFCFNVVS
jgi:hypothetical protein